MRRSLIDKPREGLKDITMSKKLTKAQIKAITTTVRSNLILMVKAANKDAEATLALKASKIGTYGLAVNSAIACKGDVAVFEGIFDSFMKDIRENVNGIAKKNGCKASEKKKGQFVVPGAVSSAKSHLKRAMVFDVSLTDEEDAPRAFSAIRDDASTLQAAYDLESADDETKERIGLLATLDQLAERASSLDGAELHEMANMVDALYASLNPAHVEDGVGDALESVDNTVVDIAATA